MATLSQTKSRRMYSWWWDSHISPKNSKWLQDNLTDVDSKVKSMIKLIEEDADSFARRAEMYYKKRPELMKLVEDLYRAYRALAERYDHATVVIRQAHRTMSEAFPNQDPSSHFYDPSESGDDPRLPGHDDQHKAGLERFSSDFYDENRNGANKEDSDFSSRIKELKQRNNLSGTGDYSKLVDNKVRKGLNFHSVGEKEQNAMSVGEQSLSRVGQVGESEEIETLRRALAKLDEASTMSNESSSLSSSIDDIADDASSSLSSCVSSSNSNESLYDLSDLMAELPLKRGLSKFYQGKSESFTCLASVTSVEDLPKKAVNSPYKKRMKSSKSYGGLENYKSYTLPKRIISKRG